MEKKKTDKPRKPAHNLSVRKLTKQELTDISGGLRRLPTPGCCTQGCC
jgi:hypothetical protein